MTIKEGLKVLVVGSGGREHALVWKIAKSPLVDKVYYGGTGKFEKKIYMGIGAADIDNLLRLALAQEIDLTVVGPEEPLALGIVNLFQENKLRIFGPTKQAAQLESSKIFASSFMEKWGIPMAKVYAVVENLDKALNLAKILPYPLVIKADGLTAGKGVYPCFNSKDSKKAIKKLLVEKKHGTAGQKIIFQEFLEGEEASYLVMTDGYNYRVLATSQDHKRLKDKDRGPNTGGMGAYSPAPVVNAKVNQAVLSEIVEPVIRHMRHEDNPLSGVLYAGLMIKNDQPRVLEFNCRFGDPETQPILYRMEDDIVPYLWACAGAGLSGLKEISWSPEPAVCVVVASRGYPGKTDIGHKISGLDEVAGLKDVEVFHAGTKYNFKGELINSGGRTLGVTAKGSDYADAIRRAYEAVDKISFRGMQYRTDIGYRALQR